LSFWSEFEQILNSKIKVQFNSVSSKTFYTKVVPLFFLSMPAKFEIFQVISEHPLFCLRFSLVETVENIYQARMSAVSPLSSNRGAWAE
jgi:hypothetical protein